MTEPAPPQPAATPPNVSTSAPPQASAIDALLAMDLRLAGLTAAVEGFAARQQELHARDYAPELAVIQTQWERAHDAFQTLITQPAITLTPKNIADQIEQAGLTVRKADHDALIDARRDLQKAVGTIGDLVASARTARDQNRWLAGVAAAALIFGSVLGAVIPGIIDHAAPKSWHWPERRAASMLGEDGWSAGERLLAVSDSDRWREVSTAVRLYSHNTDALARCARRATKTRESRLCTITVAPNRERPST